MLINTTLSGEGIWNKLKELDLEKTNKFAIIVVNAQKARDTSFSKRDFSIPLIDSLGAGSSIPLTQYSFETMELLRNNISRWRETITTGRCGRGTSSKKTKQQGFSGETPACAARTYLIEVDFDELKDESERNHLKNLPTSFHLEASDVDRLKAAAQKILTDSVEFKKLVDEMQ